MAVNNDNPTGSRRGKTSVRSYLAGTGASGSLLAAAAVAFVAVTAFVAFDGLPFGDTGSDGDAFPLQEAGVVELTAPAAAASAVAAAPGAVAAGPVVGVGADADGGVLASDGSNGPGSGPDDGTSPGPPDVGPGPDDTVSPATRCADGTLSPCNPVNEIAASLDQTTEGAVGTNPNLGGTTKPATDALDSVLEQSTGNDLGGHVDGLLGGRSTLPD